MREMETSKFTNENSKMADSRKETSDSIIKPSVQQSPIIMRVDGPPEDRLNNENEDNKKKETSEQTLEGLKICNPSIRPWSILKPPQLNVNNVPQLNPFARTTEASSEKPITENGDKGLRIATNGEPPKFLPLLSENRKSPSNSNATNHQSTSAANVSNCSFVFGQNLKDRVIAGENELESTESTSSSSASSNGTKVATSEMLFSSAIKSENKNEAVPKDKEVKSLSESAREYEESRTSKRKYEEVEVITGEENENNILKVSCKLFSFDKVSGSWQERGRGTLRLNDFQADDHVASRIVFRTTGSLRVILNTKIWAEMTVDKASDRSIRLTALDANGEIKVFLIMASIEDSSKLFTHLQIRLEREITTQKRKKGTNIETKLSDN